MKVSLREITKDNLVSIMRLGVHKNQEQFVAHNAWSIAQGTYSKLAWFRAIYADDQPVGFVMLELNPSKPEYYLWRYMIDKRHQGKGYGNQALKLVIEFVRQQPNATQLLLSYVPADGSAAAFYAKLGFVETGEVEDGENIMKLDL
ncbi:MAG: GNAT family N-acetyltransferase [Halioglobus sp.]